MFSSKSTRTSSVFDDASLAQLLSFEPMEKNIGVNTVISIVHLTS